MEVKEEAAVTAVAAAVTATAAAAAAAARRVSIHINSSFSDYYCSVMNSATHL